MNGKGDSPRNCFSKAFKDNYNTINWKKINMKNQKRDKLGRFSASSKPKRKVISNYYSDSVKRVKNKTSLIRNGSLYEWRGITVRAVRDLNNGLKLVTFHKNLYGFAKVNELHKIGLSQIEQYLSNNKICGSK